MSIAEFAAWLPDLPDYANPGATVALNVRPDTASYGPQPDLGAAASTALSARCRGAISVTATDGEVGTFAGDATKLYTLSSGTFSDVSDTGGYDLAADENWEAILFNGKVIFAAISEELQGWTLGSSVAFSTLPTSTLRPKARHLAAISRFVVLGNVDEGGTIYTNRLRWSAIDDETDYDQDPATLSDYQDLLGDFGWIQKVVSGGEYGVVISDRAIHRMEFIGPPEIFQIILVERNRGTIASGSVVAWGRLVFYLDADGFYVFDGSQSVPISAGKVSLWFFDNENPNARHLIIAAIDPENSIVEWSFAAAGSDVPNRLLKYHVPSGKWSYSEISAEYLLRALSQGYDLETTAPGESASLDATSTALDLLSLDSRFWMGGVGQMAAFDTMHTLKYFDGDNLAATLETGRLQLIRNKRALLTGFRALVDGTATVTGQVAGTEQLNAAETFGTAAAQEDDGLIAPDPVSARYHKMRVNIAAGSDWTHAQGVDPVAQADGF